MQNHPASKEFMIKGLTVYNYFSLIKSVALQRPGKIALDSHDSSMISLNIMGWMDDCDELHVSYHAAIQRGGGGGGGQGVQTPPPPPYKITKI